MAMSGFPHSRQSRLARGVINPQNGHILCDPTCWAGGASIARVFPNQSATEASRLRSRLRNEPPNKGWIGSIVSPSLVFDPDCALFCRIEFRWTRNGIIDSVGPQLPTHNHCRIECAMLSRIAHIWRKTRSVARALKSAAHAAEVSN